MKSVHLVITDLFLPNDFAAEVCSGLRLPALEKILARGASADSDPSTSSGRTGEGASMGVDPSTSSGRAGGVGASLENHLCELFGVPCQPDVPIAPISASFDGLGEGCWLRADPAHLRLQRDQLLLLPNVKVSADEAEQLCATLNEHFAGQDMEFFAPHPQRWYVRLDRLPDIETVPLSQAAGRNVRGLLPAGSEAARWHQLFNEAQMLLFAHPVNEAREAHGELPINSLWFWGGGCDTLLAKPADCGSSREVVLCVPDGHDTPYQGDCGCDTLLIRLYESVSSNEVLAEMFASAANIPFAGWAERWSDSLSLTPSRRERGYSSEGKQLLVWTGLRSALQQGDLGAWRDALQDFETGYAQPLWQALRSGKISQLQVDILGGNDVRRLLLNRADAWAFWRRSRQLAICSMV